MMKMNNSQLTPQQQELKKRLEEIRRNREAASHTDGEADTEVLRRSKGPKRNTRPQRNRRNKEAQRKRRQPAQTTRSAKPVESKKTAQQVQRVETRQSAIFDEEISEKTSKRVTQKRKTKKKNSLINQLSDADELTNAIILNEVLSKPIALRKRNR